MNDRVEIIRKAPEPMPERIQVGPFAFTVTWAALDVAKMRHDRADGRLAQTDTSNLKITIDADLPPGQVRDSVLHEALHAIVYTAGGWSKNLSEEDAISRFGSLLLDTLRRNPQLVAFLIDADSA